MSIIPSIRKSLKRITASPVSAVIMFRFFARFVCLWIWAADFLSVNRWGQQHFAFPQTARQQQTDQPSSQIQHTQPKANPKQCHNHKRNHTEIERERDRYIVGRRGGKERTSWIVIMQTNYMARKIRWCAVQESLTSLPTFECVTFLLLFAKCTVHSAQCTLCSLARYYYLAILTSWVERVIALAPSLSLFMAQVSKISN